MSRVYTACISDLYSRGVCVRIPSWQLAHAARERQQAERPHTPPASESPERRFGMAGKPSPPSAELMPSRPTAKRVSRASSEAGSEASSRSSSQVSSDRRRERDDEPAQSPSTRQRRDVSVGAWASVARQPPAPQQPAQPSATQTEQAEQPWADPPPTNGATRCKWASGHALRLTGNVVKTYVKLYM